VDLSFGALALRARPDKIDFMTNADFRQLSSVILGQVLAYNQTDMQRVAAVVHYVIAKADLGKLGHVKLNKVLWYADLEHYRWHGATITGLRQYSRTLHGPMSRHIIRAVGRLAREDKVQERTVTVTDYTRREMVSLEDPDISAFTDAQIAILDQMINLVVPLTASQLGRTNREDPLWNKVETNEAMSVATASIMTLPPRPR
jgi:antitoxin SocA-like protein